MKTISFYLALLFFSAIIMAPACNEESADSSDTETTASELFLNCWVHVYEEDPDEYSQVYQVCELDEDLPPSRFRATYTFLEDGVCEYLALSPTDAHYTAKGTWAFDEANNEVAIYNEKKELVLTMKILELGKERMIVQG